MSDHRFFAKCAWRLIPFTGLLYLKYIDRGERRVHGSDDAHPVFPPAVFGFGTSIFDADYRKSGLVPIAMASSLFALIPLAAGRLGAERPFAIKQVA